MAVMQVKHHLRTQFILKQNTNKAACCLQLQSSIFSLPLGLDTSFQLQSILTLIVQRTVRVFGAFSKQQQGALKVCLHPFSVRIWIRLCRLIRPTRYHVPRIPPQFLRGPSTTTT